MRRVVTGQAGGKSAFVSDEQIEPIRLSLMPGLEFAWVWGGDDTSLPADGTPPAAPAFFPPEHGYRFVFVTIPPEGSAELPADLDLEGALAEVNEKLPGMLEHNELENPGMHTTASVDLEFVLSGRDDPRARRRRPGPPSARATPSCRTAPVTPGATGRPSRARCCRSLSAPGARSSP